MKRKLLIALLCAAALSLLLAGTALADSSSDLGQFLTSVTITSVPGNDNDKYDIELEFAETEALQFDNDVSLLYTFPAGITIPEDLNTQIVISFSTNGTTYVVSGNAVQVHTNGNMTVNFNDSDPDFERLAEVANICFQVSIHAQISEACHEIDWNGGREGQEITVTYADPVYTVTLDPGEGTGEPITYYSTNGISTESRNTVGNCQFYYEDDGTLAFRLEDDYCPGTFTAPAGHAFDGWEGNGGCNKLSAAQTTFTARWKLLPASYTLSPAAYTLSGGGYTDIECTLTSLVLGQAGDSQADGIAFYMNGGTLADGHGNSIPFLVDDLFHWGPESRKYQGNRYSSEGETFIMAVYIDPDAYSQAVPGTYTGTFTYDSNWDAESENTGESGAIALTLVVPDHVYAIKTDGAALAYYYNDRFEQVFPTQAAEGTEFSLMLSDSAEPETGCYFTGEYTLNGVSLGRETSEDGLISWPVTGFTMPGEAVTIGAVQAERETLALSFAPGETRALPLDAWMQLQYYETAEGEPPLIWYDETTGTEALDVSRDGKPDLQIAFDDAANCVNLIRMPACAAFGAFAFAFAGPTDRCGTIAFTIPAPAFGIPDFTLPAALTTVEAEAFEGIAASVVDVPANCTSIGDRAFRNCPNLTQIRIPAGCALGTDVFDGCAMVYVFGAAESSAEAYCSTHPNCVFVPAA